MAPYFQPWITRIDPNRGQLRVTFVCRGSQAVSYSSILTRRLRNTAPRCFWER